MGDTDRLTAELLLDDLTEDERERAAIVESVLAPLAAAAVEADRNAEFPTDHVALLADAGLLGLVVPRSHGGLGGGLRDLAAATFAMGTACPSTALAFFFHNSSASRGLLGLEAIEAGLFEGTERQLVGDFADNVLGRMGTQRRWMANFASESTKSSTANISISTEATPVDGADGNGHALNGVKSFGCATGVADDYLVTARFGEGTTAEHLGVFIVDRTAAGVGERQRWDAIGMRATATHGITLDDVFVPSADALAVEGAFTTMMSMSRGSFVGNQLAGSAVYLGAATAAYGFAVEHLTSTRFADSGEPIGTAGFQQQILGQMTEDLHTATQWLVRQIVLETADPPLRPKAEVVANWRVAKGAIAEHGFAVATGALKACGTSNTTNSGLVPRMLRDLSMGLVQAFPSEKGRLEAASSIVKGSESAQFGAAKK